jgi:hypothetical protein
VLGDDTNDMTDPIAPHLRALDAINPVEDGPKAAARGESATVILPGSNNGTRHSCEDVGHPSESHDFAAFRVVSRSRSARSPSGWRENEQDARDAHGHGCDPAV